MSAGRAFETWSVGRKLACGYLAAGLVLLAGLAIRAPGVEAWLWRSLALLLPLAVSLRSALVYAYRKRRSALGWWLRPATVAENEFGATWLAYAVLLGAASLAVLFV